MPGWNGNNNSGKYNYSTRLPCLSSSFFLLHRIASQQPYQANNLAYYFYSNAFNTRKTGRKKKKSLSADRSGSELKRESITNTRHAQKKIILWKNEVLCVSIWLWHRVLVDFLKHVQHTKWFLIGFPSLLSSIFLILSSERKSMQEENTKERGEVF